MSANRKANPESDYILRILSYITLGQIRAFRRAMSKTRRVLDLIVILSNKANYQVVIISDEPFVTWSWDGL